MCTGLARARRQVRHGAGEHCILCQVFSSSFDKGLPIDNSRALSIRATAERIQGCRSGHGRRRHAFAACGQQPLEHADRQSARQLFPVPHAVAPRASYKPRDITACTILLPVSRATTITLLKTLGLVPPSSTAMMASCSTALVRQAPRRALVASPSGRAVVARGFTEDAKQSVEPRVEQLREAQLNQTTSFMGAPHLVC